MAVGGLVVVHDPSLQRIFGVLDGDAVDRGLACELQRAQRRARVAARARRQHLDRLLVDLYLAALTALERSAQQREHVLLCELCQLVKACTREQRAVDRERRVLGRGPDQRHEPFLYSGQERVLLALVEAVDLIQEEDRVASPRLAFPRPSEHSPYRRTPRP